MSNIEDKSLPSHRILMVGSVPLAKPWNGADKNLARLIVCSDLQNHYIVETSSDEDWPNPHVTPIRETHVESMPTLSQRLRAFSFMIRYTARADIIHAVASLRSPSLLSLLLFKSWCRLSGKPIVHTAPSVGERPIDPKNYFGDATIVVSKHSYNRLREAGIPNVFHVYPSIDEQYVSPKTDPEVVQREHNLGTRAVLYPAHYSDASGIKQMIRAFARIPSEFADATLVLACRLQQGQNEQEEISRVQEWIRLENIGDRVRIIPRVTDMPALIKACCVTVLVPEKLESKMDLPLVILESLFLERPVIVTDQPPINEALLDTGGFMVKYGDIEALTDALSQMLSDATLRTEFGRRGRAAVVNLCTPTKTIGAYRSVYQQVVGQQTKQQA